MSSSPPRRKRRTQKERSAETRALLLDVTVECLAELGYAGTTANVIAERAGLSRGAQLHHFGSKGQLVIAAMEHLFARMLDEFRSGYAAIADDPQVVPKTLDLLAGLVGGQVGHAYLELVIAARTDVELRQAMSELTARMDADIEATFDELFEVAEDSGDMFDVYWTALWALLEGLALERIVRPDDPKLDATLETLKAFAPLLMKPRRSG